MGNLRVLGFICLLVAVSGAIFILSGTASAQQAQEKVRVAWKLKEGLTFKYSLKGTVSEGLPEPVLSTVCGGIAVTGRSENESLFSVFYTEIRWREKGVWYTSPEEELKKMSFSFLMTSSGTVHARKGEEETAKSVKEYINSLIPLPQVPVKVGDSFNVEVKSERLAGVCVFEKYEKVLNRTCALFEMRLATPHDPEEIISKELRLRFYFDHVAGCLMRAERKLIHRERVASGGELKEQDKRVEELTVTYLTSSEEETRLSLLIENSRRQIALAPSDPALHSRLAEIYLEAGMVAESAKEFEETLRLKPDDISVLTRLGELYLALAEPQRALERFARAAQLDRSSRKALLGASSASFQLAKFQEAVQFAQIAVQSDPDHFEGYYFLGIALAKLGKEKEAKESLEKYLKLNPSLDPKGEYVIAFTARGDAQILTKRKEGGAQELKYSEDELERGREVIRILVKEESVRLSLSQKRVEQFLDYLAKIYGKTTPEMINDFLADREAAASKLSAFLQDYSRIPVGEIEAFAKRQPKDLPLLRAAYSFLEPEKAIPLLRELLVSFPDDAPLRFDVASLCILQGEKFFGECQQELELARDLDKENSLYDWALACLHLKTRDQASAIKELAFAVGKGFRTDRASQARKRFDLLESVNYRKELRKVTAWTQTYSLPERIVQESLNSLLQIAQGLLGEGKTRDAETVAHLAKYAALSVEKSADTSLLLIIARSGREAALATLINISEATGEKDLKSRQEFSQLARENSLYYTAYISFLKKCEEAFQVLPITAPAEADAFVDKLLLGEINVFNAELADILKPGGK